MENQNAAGTAACTQVAAIVMMIELSKNNILSRTTRVRLVCAFGVTLFDMGFYTTSPIPWHEHERHRNRNRNRKIIIVISIATGTMMNGVFGFMR